MSDEAKARRRQAQAERMRDNVRRLWGERRADMLRAVARNGLKWAAYTRERALLAEAVREALTLATIAAQAIAKRK